LLLPAATACAPATFGLPASPAWPSFPPCGGIDSSTCLATNTRHAVPMLFPAPLPDHSVFGYWQISYTVSVRPRFKPRPVTTVHCKYLLRILGPVPKNLPTLRLQHLQPSSPTIFIVCAAGPFRDVATTTTPSHGVASSSEYCMRSASEDIRFLAPAGFPVSGEPYGFSPTAVPRPFRKRVHPLVSFRSPAECCRYVPAPSLQYDEGAFPGVSSLFATSANSVTSGPRVPPLEPCRPRRFARPRRFPPLLALRVCFTPQPRPGFALQGVSPR
jgi:hypothetical protein